MDQTRAGVARLHKAEQIQLLVRLAADSGVRRGELAALQMDDLDEDVLTISRGTSAEVVGPTKTGRSRRLTLGAGTAQLWRSTLQAWRHRAGPGRFGPWLFSPRTDHTTRLSTVCVGHWFADLAARGGHPDITLHRLRHTVATVLVSRGDLLQAQYRLGHRGPGGFPSGIRLDNLLVAPPHPRSPLMADAFKRAGLVERTGRGINRMFAEQLR